MAVDSGACESVIDGAEQVPGGEVQETRSSKSGLVYASAAGEEIPNLGDVILPMMTKENTKRSMNMQVAEVSRLLACVKRICEARHVLVFDEDGSFASDKMTGEINQLRADQEDEYDEEVVCGQCDKLPVKVATPPRMPTHTERSMSTA